MFSGRTRGRRKLGIRGSEGGLTALFFVTSPPHESSIDLTLIQAGDRLCSFRSASFEVERGRMHMIVGSNGGGKTQLLRVMAGVERPAEGQVLTTRSRLFLSPATLSPAETIGQAIARHDVRPELRTGVDRLVDRLGLPALETLVGHLSPGQRQRVLLLLALGSTADMVFLDSPTNALDAVGRELVITVTDAIIADGRTVVVATVDPELLVLGDAVRIWVGDGRVEVQGRGDYSPALKLIDGGWTDDG